MILTFVETEGKVSAVFVGDIYLLIENCFWHTVHVQSGFLFEDSTWQHLHSGEDKFFSCNEATLGDERNNALYPRSLARCGAKEE